MGADQVEVASGVWVAVNCHVPGGPAPYDIGAVASLKQRIANILTMDEIRQISCVSVNYTSNHVIQTHTTTDAIGSPPKLFARMAWSQGFYPSTGILRKKHMTRNNIFKKLP